MFVFKPTKQTYTDPESATFKQGIPFGREYAKGDVCLLHEELSSSKIILNSKVLKGALLASKEFFKNELHLNIEEMPDIMISEEPLKPTAEVEPNVEEPEAEKVDEPTTEDPLVDEPTVEKKTNKKAKK